MPLEHDADIFCLFFFLQIFTGKDYYMLIVVYACLFQLHSEIKIILSIATFMFCIFIQ